jgi:hypothetical protein
MYDMETKECQDCKDQVTKNFKDKLNNSQCLSSKFNQQHIKEKCYDLLNETEGYLQSCIDQ